MGRGGGKMTKSNNSIWYLSGYGITLILLLYFGLNGLIASALSDRFPNAKFMFILALIFIVALTVGLGIRRYINSFTKDKRNKIKNSFLGMTVLSWIIVLILFSVT